MFFILNTLYLILYTILLIITVHNGKTQDKCKAKVK